MEEDQINYTLNVKRYNCNVDFESYNKKQLKEKNIIKRE